MAAVREGMTKVLWSKSMGMWRMTAWVWRVRLRATVTGCSSVVVRRLHQGLCSVGRFSPALWSMWPHSEQRRKRSLRYSVPAMVWPAPLVGVPRLSQRTVVLRRKSTPKRVWGVCQLWVMVPGWVSGRMVMMLCFWRRSSSLSPMRLFWAEMLALTWLSSTTSMCWPGSQKVVLWQVGQEVGRGVVSPWVRISTCPH